MRRLIFFMVFLVTVLWLSAPSVFAQGTSDEDTLKLSTAYGLQGDTVALKVYVKTASLEMASWNIQYTFDTDYVKPIIIGTQSETVYDVDFDFSGIMEDFIAWSGGGSGLYYHPQASTGPTVTGVFTQDYDNPETIINVPTGAYYEIMKLYFEISEDAELNDTIDIELFSDFSISGGILITIYDYTGTTGVEPTLVSGMIIVKDTTEPVEPEAPVIEALTSPITVIQGGKVNFTVTANDPDNEEVTLSASNIPTGATFPTVSGTGTVTGTFTWNSAEPGTWTVKFTALDEDGLSSSKSVVIIVEEILTDELFVASTVSDGTVGGIAGTTGIAVPIDLQNIQTIYGVQFDLTFDDDICDYDSVTSTDRLSGFTVYENLLGAGQLRIVTFGSDNEEIVAGTTGNTILYLWFSLEANAEAGYYPMTLSAAYESIDPDPGTSSVEMEYNTDGVIAVDMLGDVNLHPPVDVADLVSLVGYIIGDWSLTDRQFDAANVNGDTEANVVDLVNILNYVLGIQSSPLPLSSYSGSDAIVDLNIDDLSSGQNGLMSIAAELPEDVAGVQLEIGYDPEKIKLSAPELSDRAENLTLKYRDAGSGKMIVLMHIKQKNYGVISAGLGDILSIPVEAIGDITTSEGDISVSLRDIVLSSSEGTEIPVKGYGAVIPRKFNLAQNYPNPFNPRTTIVFEVLASSSSPGGSDIELVVYNILGQKVKTLASGYYSPGEYSVVWDGTDEFGKKQASGVYFYSLIANDTRTTKKMALTK